MVSKRRTRVDKKLFKFREGGVRLSAYRRLIKVSELPDHVALSPFHELLNKHVHLSRNVSQSQFLTTLYTSCAVNKLLPYYNLPSIYLLDFLVLFI